MEKITILDITTLIRLDVANKMKTNEFKFKPNEFIVVISAYDKIKDYLGFTIDDPQPNVYENINGIFHFYDDFYDYKGDKNNKDEIEKYYNQFYSVIFNTGDISKCGNNKEVVEKYYSRFYPVIVNIDDNSNLPNTYTSSKRCSFRIDYRVINNAKR